MMPIRNFDSGYWTDPDSAAEYPKDAKLLFAWAFTNDHCNAAGLYYVAEKIICGETDIDRKELPPLFELIKKKVVWYRDNKLIWVKNFIKRQTSSPKYLTAVGKALHTIHDDEAVQKLIDYNRKKYKIDLEPYYRKADRSKEESPKQSKKRGPKVE